MKRSLFFAAVLLFGPLASHLRSESPLIKTSVDVASAQSANGAIMQPQQTSSRRVPPKYVASKNARTGVSRLFRSGAGDAQESNEGQSPSDVVSKYGKQAAVSILLLLIGGALYAAHRSKGQVSSSSGGRQNIQILSSLTLAPRCRVFLLRVQQQNVLVTNDASGKLNATLIPEWPQLEDSEFAVNSLLEQN